MGAEARWFDISEVDTREILTWDDVKDDYKNMPIVNHGTYANVNRSRIIGMERHNSIAKTEDDLPVVMRGAWYNIAENYKAGNGAYVDLPRAVIGRYWRRKKVTIFSSKDYRKEFKSFINLAIGREKRSGYFALSTYGFYGSWSPYTNAIWVFGEVYHPTYDQLKVIKSIYRRIKKMDTLIGEQTWLRLQQRVI